MSRNVPQGLIDATMLGADRCDLVGWLARLAEEYPRVVEFAYNRAVLLRHCGEDEAAREAFEESLGRDPGHGPSRLQLAMMNLQAGRAGIDETIDQVQRAIHEAEFRLPEGLLALAMLQMRRDDRKALTQGRDDRANARLNLMRALALEDDWPMIHAALGQYHWWLAHRVGEAGLPDRSNLAVAARIGAAAVERFPDAPEPYHPLGLARLDLGDEDGALEAFRAGLARGSLDSGVALGKLQLARGRLPQAVRTFRSVLRRDGARVEAAVGLANALLERGEAQEARRWIDRALAKAPAHAEGHRTAAAIARRLGDGSAAAAHEARARELTEAKP